MRNVEHLPLAVLLALGLAASYYARFNWLEAVWLVEGCVQSPAQWVCGFRATMGEAMYLGQLGQLALGLSVVCWLVPGRAGRWLVLPAALAAIVALVFYNAGLGAPAAVLALLRWYVPRPAASAAG